MITSPFPSTCKGARGNGFETREIEKDSARAGAGNTGGYTLPTEKPTRAGWEFQGWSRTQSGAQAYDAGATLYYEDAMGDACTLYGLWSTDSPSITYKVNVENDTTVSGMPSPATQLLVNGQGTVSDATPTREGYEFTGWALAADGVALYQPKDEVTADGPLTFYAVWQSADKAEDVVTITLVDAKGGADGNGTTQITTYPAPAEGVSPSQFTLPDIQSVDFLGWSKAQEDSTVPATAQYAGGAALEATADATYHAIYAPAEALCKWRDVNCTPKVGQESQRKGCRNLWEKNSCKL